MGATRPSLDYLATCSEMSLESVELSRLNLAANLRKEFHEILEEWIDSEVDARMARSLLEWRRAHDSDPQPGIPYPAEPAHFEQLAIAFLPDAVSPAVYADPERGSDRSPHDVAPGCVGAIERAQSPSPIRKSGRGQVPAPNGESVAHRAVGHEDTARKPSPSLGSPSSRSTSLTRAAGVYVGAVAHLVERLSRRSRVCRKPAAHKVTGRESGPSPDPANDVLGALVAAVPPTREDVGRTVAFVPMRAFAENCGPPPQIDGGLQTPAARSAIRSAQPVRVPFRCAAAPIRRAASAS